MKLNCQRSIFLWQILLEISVFALGQDGRPDFRPRCSSLTSSVADDVIQLHKKILPSDVTAILSQQLGIKNKKCLSQEYCSLPACSLHPCLNGGTCTEMRTGYTCKCLKGYHGDNCEYADINNTSNNRSSAATTLPTDTSQTTTVKLVREVAGISKVAAKQKKSLISSSGHSTTKNDVSNAADITTKAATAPPTETSQITVGESTDTTELTTEQITSVTPSSEKSRPTTRGITSTTDENDTVTANDTATTLVASIPPIGTLQTTTVIETTSDVTTEQKTSQTPSSAQVSTQDEVNTITSVLTTKTASTPPASSETLQTSTVAEPSKTAEPKTEQITSLRLISASLQQATDEVHDTTTSLSTEAAATTGTSQTTVKETTSTADTTTEQQTSLIVVKGATTLATVNSCVGRCWFDASKPCQCNSQCPTYGDCCADYVTACPGAGSNTCSSRCGHGYDPAHLCQCNAQCNTYNNCCSDYDSLC